MGSRVVDRLSAIKGAMEGRRVTDVTFDEFDVQSLKRPAIPVNQRAHRMPAGKKGPHQRPTNVSGSASYNDCHYSLLSLGRQFPGEDVERGLAIEAEDDPL